ncbi:MAG TPA: DUF6285 domain-containing protein [Gemmatimonadaceae bacterium]|jgi:hypothetical protein|nr:DUF6285 domain-containing protein [Gemmatimonadaceae bacterium]
MQDRPTATELIAAVKHFLEQEVLPVQDDHRLRFRTLVAANALTIVQRELSAGTTLAQEEGERLEVLLGVPSSSDGDEEDHVRALRLELAQRIRQGEADQGPWRAAVMASTLASVKAKLLISNPKFVV